MKTRKFGEGESGAEENISTVKVSMNELLVEWSEQFENVCENLLVDGRNFPSCSQTLHVAKI